MANKQTIEPINQSEISTFNGTSFQNARITIEKTKSDSTANVNDQSRNQGNYISVYTTKNIVLIGNIT